MTHGIYPDDFAAMLVKHAGKKYRPSNGTEGDLFFSAWCSKCDRDKVLCNQIDFDDAPDGDLCAIIGRTFLHNAEDPEYPDEWQYGKDGQPCCTAFVDNGQPIPPERCKHTVDMFDVVYIGIDMASGPDRCVVNGVELCRCLLTNLDGICVECGKAVPA